MVEVQSVPLDVLYEADETAWLEEMSALADARRFEEMDYHNLSEFLLSMAKRDRREVVSRMVVLQTHLLKMHHQIGMESRSWRTTIDVQRSELQMLLESETLRRHAEEKLLESYRKARLLAADETGLKFAGFPDSCPWNLEQLIKADD